MKKAYPNNNIDICLITVSEADLGVRALSSYLKVKGYTVCAGFFDSWGLYTEGELESIAGWVRSLEPRIIGISSIEFSREKALQLIRALEVLGKPVVAGGADATLNPGVYLEKANYVIRGEGEESFAELADALINGKDTQGIRNLCWKDRNEKIQVNPVRPLIQDLDALPFEDWLDIEHHFKLAAGKVEQKTEFAVRDMRRGRNVYLFTIRGCAFSCSFCTGSRIKQLYGSDAAVRKISVKRVIDRVEELLRAGPLDMVYFFDDDFFLRTPDELRSFARAWTARIGLPFFAHATPLTLFREKLDVLVDAGLETVSMGIQTGSEKINFDVYRRKIRNEAVLRAAGLIREYLGKGRFGFKAPKYDFIINDPFERRDDLLETISLFKRLPKPYYANIVSLVMFEGTELHAMALTEGIVSGKDESAKYNLHDIPRHFANLVKRGGDAYLNSLLYWTNGHHTRWNYGIVPAPAIGLLASKGLASFANARPALVSFLNDVLPTHIRVYNMKMKMKKHLSAAVRKIAGRP